MEIQILNGLSRVTPDSDKYMNGLSRMNYSLDGYSLNAYSLNGFTLNGDEIDDLEEYCYECQLQQQVPSLNGYMNGRAARKARRARRKAKRAEKAAGRARRREAKTRRKELRGERKERRMSRKDKRLAMREEKRAERAERRERRGAMMAKTLASAGDIGKRLLASKLGDDFPTDQFLPDMISDAEFAADFDDFDVDDFGDEGAGIQELRLFGKPKLFKEPGKWFASNRVPTIQKVGVVAGGVLLVDQLLLGGKLTAKLTGGKKKKA